MQFDVSNAKKRRRSRSSSATIRASAAEESHPLRRSTRLSRKDITEANPALGDDSVDVSNRVRATASLKRDDNASRQPDEPQNDFKKNKQNEGRNHSEASNSLTELVESSTYRPSKRHQVRFPCVTAPDSVNQENNHNLVCSPLDESKYTLGISKHDIVCREDVLRVPDYATDIFHRLYNAEVRTNSSRESAELRREKLRENLTVFTSFNRQQTRSSPTPYMGDQDEINETMRMMLIDWLVEVHMKFRLEEETLFLCVNIIDRYLSVTNVERSKFQLVGVTALLLACKYEEIYPPLVKDCVYVTDRAYSRQDVLDMECEIFFNLDFNISTPTAYPFLQRFLFMLNARRTMRYAAHYYMDRILLEHDMLKFRPSVIAAAAVCLAVNHPCIRYTDHAKDPAPGIVSLFAIVPLVSCRLFCSCSLRVFLRPRSQMIS